MAVFWFLNPYLMCQISCQTGGALDYQDLAFAIMRLYMNDIADDVLKSLINKSYATFDDPLVTPVNPVGDIHVLELFHGPTLAF